MQGWLSFFAGVPVFALGSGCGGDCCIPGVCGGAGCTAEAPKGAGEGAAAGGCPKMGFCP